MFESTSLVSRITSRGQLPFSNSTEKFSEIFEGIYSILSQLFFKDFPKWSLYLLWKAHCSFHLSSRLAFSSLLNSLPAVFRVLVSPLVVTIRTQRAACFRNIFKRLFSNNQLVEASVLSSETGILGFLSTYFYISPNRFPLGSLGFCDAPILMVPLFWTVNTCGRYIPASSAVWNIQCCMGNPTTKRKFICILK